MTETTPQATLDDFCTTETLAKENPDLFSKSQLDWQVKTRHKNGLADSDAVLKISGRIYLRKSKYLDWFLRQKAA